MNYVEEFRILGTCYGISKASDWMDKTAKGYMAWRGGGGIGAAPTVAGCRKIIHDWAVEEAKKSVEEFRVRTVAAQNLINVLGDDVFNLSRFQVVHENETKS